MSNPDTDRRTMNPNRTFGVEIEAYGMSVSEAAALINQAGVQCVPEHYNHVARSHWKVVTDASVSGPGGAFEVVSPILRGEDGLEQLARVMSALAHGGAKVNRSCGLHVHIGARDFSLREFRNIAKNYVLFEDFFDAIMPPSRRASANVYIQSNRAAFGGYGREHAKAACETFDRCTTIDALIREVNRCQYHSAEGNRYYKLNLTAYWRHGTIEFRQHSGTVEADKACNWVRLLMQFVDCAAKSRQRPSLREMTLTETFGAFFRAFRIDDAGEGLRHYFTMRRKAFHGA